ncbi:ACP S-malonyltransferase [Leptolyngbya cf. ectocarpi LEGE 11479]|uniref:ACP S-malonyltransferase n=1 Tax=Leptolyngbya cf. ectocarpi LEGE 11479 TaxID=1828722 RepID=A0A928ZSW7_LEPEC|nr:ACP S-malonyltransferase [Leptolyngbya ectocarpi]MBE9065921.1 ACP S-malonyltransferase [Leptolyngbya cf. ectocarpi LEGE 11479]
MICLIDHNLKGHALVFFGAIASQGWLDIVSIQFVTFDELDLPTDSDDRVVWRLAQKNQMVLLTANRSMKGKDSLEQVMREESTEESLPVLTISNADRLFNDPDYRGRCVESLVEIALSLDSYRGARRVFVP